MKKVIFIMLSLHNLNHIINTHHLYTWTYKMLLIWIVRNLITDIDYRCILFIIFYWCLRRPPTNSLQSIRLIFIHHSQQLRKVIHVKHFISYLDNLCCWVPKAEHYYSDRNKFVFMVYYRCCLSKLEDMNPYCFWINDFIQHMW